MPEHAYLYLTVVAEVLMVVHLTRQESIGTSPKGFFQQEVPCPAADGDALNGTGQQFVVHQALHTESLFRPLQESQRVLALRQIAYHACTGRHSVCLCANADIHLARLQQHNVHQSQPLCHHVVDTVHRCIQVCVG